MGDCMVSSGMSEMLEIISGSDKSKWRWEMDDGQKPGAGDPWRGHDAGRKFSDAPREGLVLGEWIGDMVCKKVEQG
jgi:hypothetical protein